MLKRNGFGKNQGSEVGLIEHFVLYIYIYFDELDGKEINRQGRRPMERRKKLVDLVQSIKLAAWVL